MAKKLTQEEFIKRVQNCVGDKYSVISEYQGKSKPITLKCNIHNKEFVSNENTVVKRYEDLPYGDFKADNTIGILNNGKTFAIFDDNGVYIVNSSYKDLKKAIYNDVDYFDDFMSKNSERADDELETQILIDTKRLSPEILDESSDKYIN